MRRPAFLLLAVAIAAPAHAGNVSIDAPAGRAGDVAAAIARQTGTSVVITDPALANRQVPAIRGKLSTKNALKKLARAAGADVVYAGAAGWRLVPSALLCVYCRLNQPKKTNLSYASRQMQTLLFPSLPGRRGRLRLPVSTGFMFDFILTELP